LKTTVFDDNNLKDVRFRMLFFGDSLIGGGEFNQIVTWLPSACHFAWAILGSAY
jgi:hypothetical protein